MSPYPHIVGMMSSDTRDVVNRTWERLPAYVQRALSDVAIYEAPTPNLADAGPRDIRIRPRIQGSTAALMGVLAHELGHIAGCHLELIRTGRMTPEQAEAEADAYARSWGFGEELYHRRMWLGR